MPDLSTKNLSELDVITELGANDKVLVESGGRMKKVAGASLGGEGGVYILDISGYDEPGGGVG